MAKMQWDSFSGVVERFEGEGGWYTIPPKELVTGHFGFIPITAKMSSSEWDTSFLPAGNKTYFLALPIKIRVKHRIDVGDEVSIKYLLRSPKA